MGPFSTKGYSGIRWVAGQYQGGKLARKRRGRKGKRRRREGADKRNFEELDKYPVRPPHAFARVVRDTRSLNLLYQVIDFFF